MKTEELFDEYVDPDLEDLNLEEYFSRVDSQIQNPLDDLMRYVAGKVEHNDTEEFSYAEFSEVTPYSNNAEDMAYLVETGFVDLEFFTTERLDSDDDSHKIKFSSEKQAIAHNLAEIDEEQIDRGTKFAMPGIEDAALSIGEVGEKYIAETEIDYSGEQAVEAYNRTIPAQAETRKNL